MTILNAEQRNEILKVKQLRKTGYVPGVLYGKNLEESLAIQFPLKDIKRFLKTNKTGSMVDLLIGEKKYKSLLKEITFAPVAGSLEHLSFQTLITGEKITSTAQIVLINKEDIIDTVRQLIFELSYRAFPPDLFDKIEIDMEGKKAGDMLRISDLEIINNEDIEIKNPLDSVVVSVIANNLPVDDAPEEEKTEQ